MLRHCSC